MPGSTEHYLLLQRWMRFHDNNLQSTKNFERMQKKKKRRKKTEMISLLPRPGSSPLRSPSGTAKGRSRSSLASLHGAVGSKAPTVPTCIPTACTPHPPACSTPGALGLQAVLHGARSAPGTGVALAAPGLRAGGSRRRTVCIRREEPPAALAGTWPVGENRSCRGSRGRSKFFWRQRDKASH